MSSNKKKPSMYENEEQIRDFFALALKLCLSKNHDNVDSPEYYIDEIKEVLEFYHNSFSNAYNATKIYSPAFKPIVKECINKLIFSKESKSSNFDRNLENLKNPKKYSNSQRKRWIKSAMGRTKQKLLTLSEDKRKEYYPLLIFTASITSCYLITPKNAISKEKFEGKYLKKLPNKYHDRLQFFYKLSGQQGDNFYRLEKEKIKYANNLIELQKIIFLSKHNKK
nr:hypothetical protein [uncultured Draconibacterium sp.]